MIISRRGRTIKRIWLPKAWAYIPCACATEEQVREACERYGVARP